MKRFTPEDDVDRLAERVWNWSGKNIQSREDFEQAYFDYLGEDLTDKQMRKLKNQTWDRILFKHLGGGKNLKQDRKKTSQTIARNVQEYKKLGAQNSDLSGLDTKNARKISRKQKTRIRQREYNFKSIGRIKGKVVYARRTIIFVKGKKQARFRDRKGRFVSTRRR